MATTPPPSPDHIDPGSPNETPSPSTPDETPFQQPDEIEPPAPDFDQPDQTPQETPPLPD